MERNKFNTEELIGFLEEKVKMDVATQDELKMYENYLWSGKLKGKLVIKGLVKQMYELWCQGF